MALQNRVITCYFRSDSARLRLTDQFLLKFQLILEPFLPLICTRTTCTIRFKRFVPDLTKSISTTTLTLNMPHNDKKKKIRVSVTLAFSNHTTHIRLPKNKEVDIYEAVAKKLMKKGKWGIYSVLDIEELGMMNRSTDDNFYRCPQRVIVTKGDKFQVISRNVEKKGHGLSYTKKTVHQHHDHHHKKHHRSTSGSNTFVTPVYVDSFNINTDCTTAGSTCDCGSNNGN
jgi:hypothetical protein